MLSKWNGHQNQLPDEKANIEAMDMDSWLVGSWVRWKSTLDWIQTEITMDDCQAFIKPSRELYMLYQQAAVYKAH